MTRSFSLGQVGAVDVGPVEVGPVEVGVAEVRQNVRVLLAPRIPHLDALPGIWRCSRFAIARASLCSPMPSVMSLPPRAPPPIPTGLRASLLAWACLIELCPQDA